MSEKKQRRSWTPDEKTEIVLAGLRGDRSVRDVCREHVISETQYYQWRDRLLEAGKAALRRPNDKSSYDAELEEARKRIAQLERALGRKTYDLEVAGKLLRDWELSVRVARARELVAEGDQATAAARIAQISRQAIYKTPQRRPPAAGPGRPGADDAAIVEIAKAHPTDGTRMVAAIASRQLGEPVNRKRAQRIMRTHRLLQPTRGLGRRRRPGYFRVRRPDEL